MEREERLHGEERGAGGKLRKPHQRKPQSTPYDRPPPPPQQTEPQIRLKEDGGWWLSKLVDPAARIISGGATRFFPSFFPKPPLASPASDADQPDVKQDDVDDEPQQTSDIQMYRPDEGESAPKEAGRPKSGSNTNQQVEDKLDNPSAGTGLSEIERMVKEKVFSREELHRLTEILYSRMVAQPDANHHGKEIPLVNKGEAVVRSLGNDNTKTLAVGKQVDMGPISRPIHSTTSRNEGGTSPVKIAKAYMGTQMSELGFCSRSIVERDEKTPLPTSLTADGFSPKSSIHSPAHKPSPCWPGAMIQDQHAYLTPQTERVGVRLHNLPRTPYSRTVFSRSTSKLQGNGDRFLNVSSVQWKQSETPVYGDSQVAMNMRISLDDDFGSAGPIRRTRRKFAGTVTPTRGPDTFHSLRYDHLLTESSESLLPMVKQKVEPRASTSSSTNFHLGSSKAPGSSLGLSAVHPQSAVMAKKILEHLDRTIPTPQKKLAELKLATSWRRTSSPELTAIRPNAQITESHLEGSNSQQSAHLLGQKSSAEEKEVTGKSLPKFPTEQRKIDEATVAVNSNTSTSNAVSSMIDSGSDGIGFNIEPFSNFKMTPDFLVNTHEVSVGLERDQNETNKPISIQKQIEVYDTSDISRRGNGSKQTFGNKLALASISVTKPGSKFTVPLDNGFGFSFPVSASSGALSEPPTPSIMPSPSVGNLPRPEEKTTVPSYSFGSKKSDRLVFSFPSTNSSATNDASTPVFTFGSNEKARMSFRSVGKDAICY